MSFMWMHPFSRSGAKCDGHCLFFKVPRIATRGQNRQHDQSLCCEMSLVAFLGHAAEDVSTT